MATTAEVLKQVTLPDLKGKVDPDWCPGCGDFGVLAAFQKALVELQIQPYNVVTISGIGCSSNLPGFIETYGMHTLHGRALAVATGVKMANHDLTVVVTGGDGHGQPDLRADDWPGVAHQPHRHEDQEYAFWQRRGTYQSDCSGAGGGRHIRGPRFQRRSEASNRPDQARAATQRLLVHRYLQPVCDLQSRQHVSVVQ